MAAGMSVIFKSQNNSLSAPTWEALQKCRTEPIHWKRFTGAQTSIGMNFSHLKKTSLSAVVDSKLFNFNKLQVEICCQTINICIISATAINTFFTKAHKVWQWYFLSCFQRCLSIPRTISVTAILSLPSNCDISHFSWRQVGEEATHEKDRLDLARPSFRQTKKTVSKSKEEKRQKLFFSSLGKLERTQTAGFNG